MSMRAALLVALTALAGSGCYYSNDYNPPPPVPLGTLTLDWTINGTKDPNQCNQAQAVALEITITTTAGAFAGTYQQACQTFATSITLSAGSYVGNASLIDPNGQPRTTQIALQPFTIIGGSELVVPIDFPANSFF